MPLPSEHAERAAYVIDGGVPVGEESVERGRVLVFAQGPRWCCTRRPMRASC
ncbi:MAG TPA: hypothetical protein VNW89_11335 [Stellaceae bacterium]|nr:hypothetical protein [Stellaceae bacterium]